MTPKHVTAALLAAAIVAGPAGRAAADGDAIVGGIIGGIIGGAIVNEANKNRRTNPAPANNAAANEQRAQNREVQTALNYFGFNAGTPDGVFGRNTRTAVSSYQLHLGYPPTGQLTDFERDFLLSSFRRAQAGGANTLQMIAATPGGAAGLLVVWRDEMAGRVVPAPVLPAPQPTPTPTLPVIAEVPAQPALPNFMAQGGTEASLASFCNKVGLLTNTNGGFTTLANLRDPDTALSEQFCLARTYAIATGEELAARITGFTSAQIEAQCRGLGQSVAGPVGALSLRPADQVVAETAAFIRQAGVPAAQLAGSAKVCLSIGYRTDSMEMAVGSALLLVGLGETVYGELLGHHLMQGMGASQRPDLARDWYSIGLSAIDAGRPPVFAPGQPERTELIRAAVFGVDTRRNVGNAKASEPVKNTLPRVQANP